MKTEKSDWHRREGKQRAGLKEERAEVKHRRFCLAFFPIYGYILIRGIVIASQCRSIYFAAHAA
jgi:hypothetical protein